MGWRCRAYPKLFLFLSTVIFVKANGVLDEKAFTQQADSNSLLVRFEYVIPADWTATIYDEFKNQIATLFSSKCQQSPDLCNVTNFGKFGDHDVKIASEYPKEKLGDSLLSFYVVIPTEARKGAQMVVPKVILTDTVEQNKATISEGLRRASESKDSVSFRIAYIEEELVRDSQAHRLNTIIIPIACGVMLLLLLLVVSIECYRNRRNEQQLKRSIEEQKKQKQADTSPLARNSRNGEVKSTEPPQGGSNGANICELPDVAITQ